MGKALLKHATIVFLLGLLGLTVVLVPQLRQAAAQTTSVSPVVQVPTSTPVIKGVGVYEPCTNGVPNVTPPPGFGPALCAATPVPAAVSPSVLVPCTAPVGQATALPLNMAATPNANAAAIPPQVACAPVSSTVNSVTGAIGTISMCGAVTGYSAPGSINGSVALNGLTFSIPIGSYVPSYVAVGGTIFIVVTSPQGQIVEISPGFCKPLAATAPSLGGAAFKVGKMLAF